LEQIDCYQDLKSYLNQLELYLKSHDSKKLSMTVTPAPELVTDHPFIFENIKDNVNLEKESEKYDSDYEEF